MAAATATAARSSSFLPTVKCSNCNATIEISLMSDHVCSQVITVPEFHFLPRNGSFSPSLSKPSNKPSIVNSGLMQPSRIDTSATRPPALPHGVPSGIRRVQPLTASDGHRTDFQSRTTSGMMFRRVGPSPPNVSVSQDSAFPPFPTAKPSSKSPSASLQSFSFPKSDYQTRTGQDHSFAPLSPRDNGGGSVLQRMDGIAPGPFQLSGKADFRPTGHKRTATMSSSKDFTHQPIVGVGKGHFQRPSTSGSIKASKPSLSSISRSSQSALDRDESHLRTTTPVPLVRSQTASIVSTESGLESDHQALSIETLRQENRSRTYPLDTSDTRQREDAAGSASRKYSEPSHVKKPSISAASAIRPLHEIGSVSSFKSSRSVKGRAQDRVTAYTSEITSGSTRRVEARNDNRLDDSPPVPLSTQPLEYHIGNPYHTPTESTASSDSTRSDTRSGSSTSTSPLSDSPQWQKRRPSNASQGGNPKTDLSCGTESLSVGKETPSQRTALPSFSRPMYTRPNDLPLSLKVSTLAPGSTVDPAIQSGRPSPTRTPENQPSPSFPLKSGNLLLSPASPPPAAPKSPSRKPKPINKGKCRGCQELIHGKSVSSADGRLTGRYHKRCFVCTTCREPFRTADFYILDNQPYCGRHYHLLNGSMCMSCDRGIEGQYLETETKQKFHRSCFTCQTCRGILHDEYYEMNGKTFCERHAFATSPQTSLLGPGRRHPERRTTRLMMM
ncbi:hypothetical protein MMC07_000239 [Pseudocyphellaria aurata]|nr:hypothetical protein [Pseudocyphellaria aurata]